MVERQWAELTEEEPNGQLEVEKGARKNLKDEIPSHVTVIVTTSRTYWPITGETTERKQDREVRYVNV
jgi:hypothetical protein